MDLADSTQEEEARNAALAAIRLIKRHQLKLLEGAPPPANDNVNLKVRRKVDAKPKVNRKGELGRLAAEKIYRFVEFLRRKAANGHFPACEARALADRSIKDGTISQGERELFLHYLRRTLRDYSSRGVVEYVPGKGHRLRPNLMWGNAA